MSRIDGWPCRLPGDREGRIYAMVRVDEQSEASYNLHGDLSELKTFIYHDGSRYGKNEAQAIARSLDESGVAVRDLGRPGIVAIYLAECHELIERRTLRGV